MCFHEVHVPNWEDYISRLAALCSRFLVLKVFSEEGKKRVLNLGNVFEGATKHSFSRVQLEQLYGSYFEILNAYAYSEDEHPIPPHEDGPVAAKMAYLMMKRQ